MLAAGKYNLHVSYAGYDLYSSEINISSDQPLEISLRNISSEMSEVVVTGEKNSAVLTPFPLEVSSK